MNEKVIVLLLRIILLFIKYDLLVLRCIPDLTLRSICKRHFPLTDLDLHHTLGTFFKITFVHFIGLLKASKTKNFKLLFLSKYTWHL